MGVLPSSRAERLAYFEARVALWIANATSIGISAAQATAVKNAAIANRADLSAADIARAASKAATQSFYVSNDTLVSLGRDIVKTVKAYAETTNNPDVYALANIDPPSPPTPVPTPDVPTELTGTLSPFGVATLTWEATKSGASSGIFFVVARKRQSEADFTVLGATAEKSFIDPHPQAAEGPVYYQARAVRGADGSDWCMPVVFDLAGAGLIATRVTTKLAA